MAGVVPLLDSPRGPLVSEAGRVMDPDVFLGLIDEYRKERREDVAVDRVVETFGAVRAELNALRFDLDMVTRRVVELTHEVRGPQ